MLESISHGKGNNIPVKVPWQGWTDWQTFAIAVKVIVRLPGPLPLKIPRHSGVWRLEVRLQRTVYLADVHKIRFAADSADPIASVQVKALQG